MTWQVSEMPMPGENATTDVLVNYVHNQLDRVEASHSLPGSTVDLLDGLRFTGSGPQDRLQGGSTCFFTLSIHTGKCVYIFLLVSCGI